uniref:Uncharacterized protein n=1 Tax=Tetradesmus obliquus TaxID=3088 RepID=A0A383V6H8_TETOB|eukprot:jgi/Sobl393_1/13603/SZX60319.1
MPLATFDCGAPNALCGASIPAGVKCPKGPGDCSSGYFCGWTYSDSDKTTRCMPLPADCGKAGKPCCPGNAAKQITDLKNTPKPTCNDGSYCFFTPTPDGSGWSAPAFASPAGPLLGTCRPVPKDCGSAPGKPCCPSLYHRGVNPALPSSSMTNICSAPNTFCQYTPPGDKAFDPDWQTGTCVANKPDCGKIGSSCCIWTSGVSTNSLCGSSMGQPGNAGYGYCAYPGGKVTKDMRDQQCLSCPDKKVAAAEPMKYFGCPSMREISKTVAT